MTTGETNTTEDLLGIALDAAVPLWIDQIRRERWDETRISNEARTCSQIIASEGDNILFRAKKKGKTAAAFNALACGLACLSFAPGGVKFLGRHWTTPLDAPTKEIAP